MDSVDETKLHQKIPVLRRNGVGEKRRSPRVLSKDTTSQKRALIHQQNKIYTYTCIRWPSS